MTFIKFKFFSHLYILLLLIKESQLESTRNELSLVLSRSDSLSDDLFETRRKLNQTIEEKLYLKEEIKETEKRLIEAKNQVNT